MQLDGSVDPSLEYPNAIRNKLNKIKLKLKDVAKSEFRDETTCKNTINMTIPKFNGQLENWPS